MVPVLDMFNHAGDEVRNLLTSRSRACDNCRWQAVAPENNPTNEWVMQVRNHPAGAEPALLDYRTPERSKERILSSGHVRLGMCTLPRQTRVFGLPCTMAHR